MVEIDKLSPQEVREKVNEDLNRSGKFFPKISNYIFDSSDSLIGKIMGGDGSVIEIDYSKVGRLDTTANQVALRKYVNSNMSYITLKENGLFERRLDLETEVTDINNVLDIL